jgi:hypothetical protein
MQYGKKAIEKEAGDLRMFQVSRRRLRISYHLLQTGLAEEKKQMQIWIGWERKYQSKHI